MFRSDKSCRYCQPLPCYKARLKAGAPSSKRVSFRNLLSSATGSTYRGTALVLHNLRETGGIKTGAANQCAVNFSLGNEGCGVIRLHAAAVKNPQTVGEVFAAAA